ncbi:Maf family protein [Tepidicella xavieri]|uniref:dTTP/UTP pyrophosphatase n=1 Tax=Tepidicella xavieri TaxID=360241 RepID=A0A4R6UFQ3_9BURK|nr:Maf family protein [Tepidicella xavieri]TDQ43725.1 septum formation protein [Tepidicella xavieri]
MLALSADSPWVYLASQSPRRRELLAQWGIRAELLLPDADEDAEALEAVRPREWPSRYVQRVTRHKLDAALARLQRRGWPDGPVLCADTTVALGRQILGKPASKADARRMLQALSGQRHQVLTAVALAHRGQVWQALSRSEVEFGPWSAADIRRYVDSGEPMGKAGAYAIQGAAGLFVKRIRGSHSGIVGLPAYETAQLLRAAGLRLL